MKELNKIFVIWKLKISVTEEPADFTKFWNIENNIIMGTLRSFSMIYLGRNNLKLRCFNKLWFIVLENVSNNKFWNNLEQILRPMMYMDFHCQNISLKKRQFTSILYCLSSKMAQAFLKVLLSSADIFMYTKMIFFNVIF